MRDAELRIPHPASRKVRDAGCGLRNRRKLPFSASIGGSFNADTFYGAIDVKGFSGAGVVDENPNSERMYYSQLFYRSYPSHQQSHEIHITFVWNDDPHINVK